MTRFRNQVDPTLYTPNYRINDTDDGGFVIYSRRIDGSWKCEHVCYTKWGAEYALWRLRRRVKRESKRMNHQPKSWYVA